MDEDKLYLLFWLWLGLVGAKTAWVNALNIVQEAEQAMTNLSKAIDATNA